MEPIELERVSCNFCKSKDYVTIYRGTPHKDYYKEMFYPTSASFQTENIVKCKKCNLIFTNSRIRPDILLKLYVDGEDKKYIEQISERGRAFDRAIRFIETFSSKGSMLDIGCGAGFLLSAAKKRGWGVKGVEINPFFANFANTVLNVNVVNEAVEKIDFKTGTFDVIVMWDTLEHMYDPYLILSKSYVWLKEGGYIFINTPNINSIVAKALWCRWWFREMHLYYFSPQIINMYFKKIGFKYLRKRRYVQTLKLSYLISKFKPQWRFLHNIPDNIIISYYGGQMTVAGQKRP